ncbi:MAG: MG2 domain-containing protein, partial [Acidobacteriota bacterium]
MSEHRGNGRGGWAREWFAGLLLGACALALAAGCIPVQGEDPARRESAPTPPGRAVVAAPAEGWKEVAKLVEDQKAAEALKRVEELGVAARAAGDEEGWTRGLIQQVQLRTALHGYEGAVRFLKEQEWPRGALSRAALNLFYGRSLANYLHMYSWEINQREKVESRQEVDLKAWTRDEIFAAAQQAYLAVWEQRGELGGEPLAALGEYLEANNFPPGIRSTLRDAVSYLHVELLADTGRWRPEQSDELYMLDLKGLLSGAGAGAAPALVLADPQAHPLAKIAAILDDLESWHRAAARPEAALEARLELLRRLQSSFTAAQDRALIRADLERSLNKTRDLPWWAAGQALLAEMVRDSDERDNLVRARALAEEGWKAYPKSVGGQRCRHLVKAIEAPELRLDGMITDGPGRHSLALVHKNLERAYFRAYLIDLVSRLATSKDYNLLPAWREVEQIVARETPSARWQVELPATPDLKLHRSYLTPQLATPGLFVVVASQREDFARKGNQLVAVDFIVTNLVLLSRQPGGGGIELTVLQGDSGQPVAGAEVTLYRFDWQQGHRPAGSLVTDAAGAARFRYEARLGGRPYFALARSGGDLTLEADSMWFNEPARRTETTASLIFTDRSVYRPLQKLLFKVLAYRSGGEGARFEVLPGTPVTVKLLDANGEEVDQALVTTNEFGSAAGELAIPAGRLLGAWRLESSLSGDAEVRVEEYKRPTFEVSVKDPEGALRLNRPATFVGEARYYFGL